MITPINGLRDITAIGGAQGLDGSTGIRSILPQGDDGNFFASIFQSAIQNVINTDAEAVQTQYLLSTGQLDNPAAASIASTKNEIAVSLLIQLRNKALDAYSELTRLSI